MVVKTVVSGIFTKDGQTSEYRRLVRGRAMRPLHTSSSIAG